MEEKEDHSQLIQDSNYSQLDYDPLVSVDSKENQHEFQSPSKENLIAEKKQSENSPKKKRTFKYLKKKTKGGHDFEQNEENSFGKDLEIQILKEEEEQKLALKMKAEKKLYAKISSYITKDYLMFFVMLLAPSFNYNYLYLPYLFIGMLYLPIVGDLTFWKMRLKYLCELYVLNYSCYLLIFKIISICLITAENEYVTVEKKQLFTDLGICWLKNLDSNFYFYITFANEIILIAVGGYANLLSFHCRTLKPSAIRLKVLDENKIRKYILIIYFFLIGYTMFNLSYISLFYMICIQFVLFLSSLKINVKCIKVTLKTMVYLFIILIALQIILINLFNIPSFQTAIKTYYTERDLTSTWIQIGINYENYTEFSDIIQKFIGYLCAIISLMMITKALSKINNDLPEGSDEKIPEVLLQKKKKKITIVINAIVSFLSHRVINFELTRMISIVWTYFYRNFFSLGILIYIFISFFHVHTKKSKFLIIFILLPMVFVTLIAFHVSNITGIKENLSEEELMKYKRFAFYKFNYKYIEYFLGHVYFIFIMFLIYGFLEYDEEVREEKENEEENQEIEMTQIKNDDELNEKMIDNENNNIIVDTKYSINDASASFSFDVTSRKTAKPLKPIPQKTLMKQKTMKPQNTIAKPKTLKKQKTLNENIVIQVCSNVLFKKDNTFKFTDLLLKGLLMNIDKITLVAMYFVSVYTVNLIHMVLVFIFIIQIISPGVINYCYSFNVLIFQALYFIEFIVDLLKIYYITEFNEYKSLLQFIFVYSDDISSNDLEIYIYGVIYCFYFQFRTLNIDTIKSKIENKNITLKNYITNKFANHPFIENFLFKLGGISLHIYLWSIVALFIFFISYYEINFLFGIKLILFLLCCLIFLFSIQIPKEGMNLTCARIFNRILLLYCCLNTLGVYIYQFLNKDLLNFKTFINESSNFFLKNLPNIGLTIYKDENLYYNFMPHFMTTFIGVLFTWETERCLLDGKKKFKHRRATMSHVRAEERRRKMSEKKRLLKIEKEENEFVKDKLYADLYDENDKSIKEMSKQLIKASIIKFISKCYWLFIFLAIGIIFGGYNLSYSMLLYAAVYGFFTMKKFLRIAYRLKKYIKNKSYYISKVLRYSLVEKPRHYEINTYYHSKIFRHLLVLTCLYYICIYFYGIFDLFQHGCDESRFKGCDNNHSKIVPSDEESEDGENNHNNPEAMIKSIAYLFGIYFNVQKDSILKIALPHLILFFMIVFDVYNQKIYFYYYDLYENLQIKIQKIVNDNNILEKYSEIADMNILIKIGLTVAGIDLSGKKNNNINNKDKDNTNKRFTLKEQFGDDKSKKENNINTLGGIIEENNNETQIIKKGDFPLRPDEPKDNVFESYDLNENIKGNEFLKNRKIKRFLEMIKNSNENEQQLSVGNGKLMIIFGKKIFEETILVFLMCVALGKSNIWTFIYLLISFFLIAVKKTVWKFFILACFIYLSILFQSILFLINVSEKTATIPITETNIFDILDIKLGIPWYSKVFDEKNGFFFGFGVNSSQVKLIWLEFMMIIVLHFYLDIFCYSIYQDILNLGETSSSKQKFDFDSLNLNPNSMQRIQNMSEMEFIEIRDCLKCFNFNIGNNLKEFFKLLNIKNAKKKQPQSRKSGLNLDQIKNPVLRELIENRMLTKEMKNNLENQEARKYRPIPRSLRIFQEILYMYFHCFLLVIIIILSIMVAGMLSAIYFGVAFYYLIISDYLYLGLEYTYPSTLKNILRYIVLIDISLQGIYQIPYISIDSDDLSGKILRAIGLIKAVDYNTNMDEITTFQTLEIFGKAFIYFFISLQIIIYGSKNFKRYYLVYLLETKYEQKKSSLINAFCFNNKRVKIFEKSFALRQKTDKAMEDLGQMISDLNEKLGSVEQKKLITKKDDDETNKLTKKSSKKVNILLANKNYLTKNNQKEENLEEEEEEEEEYLDVEEVKTHIKNLLTEKLSTKLYLWFHKNSATYKSIDPDNKLDYDIETIKGKTKIKSIIENDINRALAILKLDNLDRNDLSEVDTLLQAFFDPKIKKELETKKKLEEKAKKRVDKFRKFGNNLLKLVRFKRMMFQRGDKSKVDNNTYNTNLLELFRKQSERDRKERELREKEEREKREKLKQFEELLDTDLFQKYLKTSYQLKHILLYLLTFFMNNFSWVCYIFMILDHMLSASVVTIFYPLSIFCYAILEYPRPKRFYWLMVLFYTMIIICAKFIIQMKVIIIFLEEDKYSELIQIMYNNRLGIKYFKSAFNSEFVGYIIFDALVALCVLINRNLLISEGLWETREDEIENIYEASERIAIFKDKKYNNKFEAYIDLLVRYLNSAKEILQLTKYWNLPDININHHKKFDKTSKTFVKYDEAHKSYFQKLFPNVRNEKPGQEFYQEYTITLFLICVYILLFFTQMDQDKTYGTVNLDTTQFSGTMVIFLILHIIILTYDRVIFVSQNREFISYEYIFYKKSEQTKFQGILLSTVEESQLKSEICESNEKKFKIIPAKEIERLKNNYNIIFIQREQTNKPLMNKYGLHIFCTILIHFMAFFYFPIIGNTNLGNRNYCEVDSTSCNDFTKNSFIIFFYLLYLIYLIFSGLQVKYGFYDIKRKSLFKKKDDEMLSNLFKAYQQIPFLYELKNAIDWTCTSTCLSYFQWNKFEAIYDTIFDTYCEKSDWDEKPIGERVSLKEKLSIGATMSFALIFILIIPLILFSSLNPTNKLNNLTAAKITVDLSFSYENGAIKNYNIFENSRADSISEIFSNGDSIWYNYNYSKSVQTRNFNHKQVQRVIFSETSDRNWDLANPHIKNLLNLMNLTENNNNLSSIDISINYELTRPLPAEAQTCSNSFTVNIFNKDDDINSEGGQTIKKLRDAIGDCSTTNIVIYDAYTPALRLTSGSEVTVIEDDNYFTKKNITIGFQGCTKTKDESGNEVPNYFNSYYTVQNVEFYTENNETKNKTNPLEFHIFSDQISETTQGYSVLTFYISFVLLAGSYIREFLENEPEEITLGEMPHPKKIVDLCEGIKIARYSYDFKTEEYLYTVLIELMRSPDYLKLITDSSLDHFKMREKLTESEL